MKAQQRAPTTAKQKTLLVSEDCEAQAQRICKRLGVAVEKLRDGDWFGTLDAIAGQESEIRNLEAVVKLLVRIRSGLHLEAPEIPQRRSPKRSDEQQ